MRWMPLTKVRLGTIKEGVIHFLSECDIDVERCMAVEFLCIMLLDKLGQNRGHYGFVKIGSENFYMYHNGSEVDSTQIMATLKKRWDLNGKLCMLSCKLNILEWWLGQLYCNEGSVFLLHQYSKMNNNLNMTKNVKVKLYTKNRVYITEQYVWYI